MSIPSTVAFEDMFEEDKSKDIYIKTGNYHDEEKSNSKSYKSNQNKSKKGKAEYKSSGKKGSYSDKENYKNKDYRTEELDLAIMLELNKLAIDPEYVEHVRENKPKNDVNEKIKSITSEIEKINSQISKMMDLYALGTIDMDVISTKVAELNKTKTALQNEIDSLDVPEEDEMTVEEVQSIAAMMADKNITLADKRNIIQSLIYYIEIDNDEILIHWKF